MNATRTSKFCASWKGVLCALVAPTLLFSFGASAAPASAAGEAASAAQELVLTQFDFGGMDLSDDGGGSSKKKKKGKKKKKKSKKGKKGGKKSGKSDSPIRILDLSKC